MALSGVMSMSQVLFAPERLAKVNGVHSRKIYIAILGQMFDVTKGRHHYGEHLLVRGRFSAQIPESLARHSPIRVPGSIAS